MEVEGVAEDELVAEVGDLGGRERANAAAGGQRNECRGRDGPPGEPEPPGSGGSVACRDLEVEALGVASHDPEPRALAVALVALLGRGAVDAAGADRDPMRLALLRLRDPDLEDAVAELGVDRVGVDALGQAQRPREAAESPLDPVIAVGLLLVLGPALTGDGEDVVVDLDVDVVLAQA